MKQKTKKLLQLSFSLGFLATTALVATSCNQPKTVTPKPTNPTPMQPGNGSGSGTTTTPGIGETMQLGNGSGSGTGTTTADNSEAKNQLKALIDGKDAKLAMYDDYSMIKTTLANAYATAKTIDDKADATKDELTTAKTTLETAISKAATDKTKFDNTNKSLVDTFISLKMTFKSINLTDSLSTLGDDSIYDGIRNNVNKKYNAVKSIIDSGVQREGLKETDLSVASEALISSISKIEEEKNDVKKYTSFKLFKIEDKNFKGSNLYSSLSPSTQSIVAYSQDFNNSESGKQWKYAKRMVEENADNSDNLTDVRWIYNLNSQTTANNTTPASYEVGFTYYGGSNATLYFPYKLIKEEDKSKLSLKYKLNDNTINDVDVSQAKVDEISVAKIDLTDLNFGENKIAFSTEMGKAAPMMGNIYIASTDKTSDEVHNDIFGNKVDFVNNKQITVDLVKGYGLANRDTTKFKKINAMVEGDVMNQTQNENYVIENLGGKYSSSVSTSKENIQFYSFYVNAPEQGTYDISGLYSSNQNLEMFFWRDKYDNPPKKAKFQNLNSANKIKVFNSNMNSVASNPSSMELVKGLNKIVVSGGTPQTNAPNLLNVTFTLQQQTI
ncbi:Vmc-like lipoprotein signal peptide domain-containing protein [Mycoplasma bradburyae]|uniref:Vmc-like lipoprotein signal peptide domain-containing protein n=1 Tax=Mycoplasma bradburyae TaxID=2963128 RepID=UPI0023410A9E|nr:hypothetical protein [Mycoplasma bradburyae]MDC4182793.1 hypothetical protein [Mycoplasma bradburyae]